MKTKKALIPALCVLLCVAVNSSCNHENMSRVTLYLGINDQAINIHQKGLLHKIVTLFISSAQAKSVSPLGWTEDYDNVTLTVTGNEMDTITAVIPPSAASYTIEVPAGEARFFTLIATNSSGVRSWGGHVISDLNAGEVNLTLRILPIPNDWDHVISFGENIIGWSAVVKPFVTSHNLYRSSSAAGIYTKIYTGPNPGSTGYYDSVPTDSTFYYKASINTTYGEGELSDYRMIYNNM